MRWAVGSGVGIGLALLGFVPWGCSLVVPGELDEIHCQDENSIGPPACPAGQVCGAGVCTACQASEACGDGVDNDCDGVVDCGEGGVGTPTGAPCDPGGVCPEGQFCIDPAAHGLAGLPFCTRGCCSSESCGPGAMCWTSPWGASVCRLPADMGLPAPGATPTGEPCTTHAECRSSLCDPQEGRCTDSCCKDADCPGDMACRWGAFGQSGFFRCATQAGGRGYQERCAANSDCRSDACLPVVSGLLEFNICTASCCNSETCGSVVGLADFVCAYVGTPDSASRICFQKQAGDLRSGQPCGGDGDCRSARCIDGLCADTCCTDADCGSGLACRPVYDGPTFVLRCLPL